ncbi:MAG: lipid-A-disaccharide synthase, partial [Blastocatellia bacterium]
MPEPGTPQSPLSEGSGPLAVMIVAGEASGEKHGAALARALQELHAGVRIFGAGGDEMRAAGVETLIDIRDLAIIGVPEIIRALPRFYTAYRTLVDAARSRRPDIVVLIDWPDFNLRLAKKLHRERLKIVYYISPQVWAWRKYRIRAIKRYVDRMLVILPFEAEFYRSHGVEVDYVGHPLTAVVHVTGSREEFAARAGLDPSKPIIALLPGSRRKEIHYHMPALIHATRLLNSRAVAAAAPAGVADQGPLTSESSNAGHQANIGGPFQFVIPVASTIDPGYVRGFIDASAADSIKVVNGEAYNALGHAEAAVVASGTATVEAALLGTPMVIIYKGSELNWRLIRPLIHLDMFGMVNLIAGWKVVPELIQHEVTGQKIADALRSMLASPLEIEKI